VVNKNEFEGLSLDELFAKADEIGQKYQAPEEIQEYQEVLDDALEALQDTIKFFESK
jgi:hypothetical protein